MARIAHLGILGAMVALAMSRAVENERPEILRSLDTDEEMKKRPQEPTYETINDLKVQPPKPDHMAGLSRQQRRWQQRKGRK